jgi:hypothetical protein
MLSSVRVLRNVTMARVNSSLRDSPSLLAAHSARSKTSSGTETAVFMSEVKLGLYQEATAAAHWAKSSARTRSSVGNDAGAAVQSGGEAVFSQSALSGR